MAASSGHVALTGGDSAVPARAPRAPVVAEEALRCHGQPGQAWGSRAVGSSGRTGPPHGRARAPAADSAPPGQAPLVPGPSVEDETDHRESPQAGLRSG